MSEYVLRTYDLTKKYGKQLAVDHVNLKVRKGEIYGFIGLNGAGKSTFIRLVTGLAHPTGGKIELFGKHAPDDLNEARRKIGTIIEHPALFPHMTAEENLEVLRRQRGIPGKRCIYEVLEKVGLIEARKKKVKKFSLGMKQRLGLAIALLSKPEFLILDEPINGLDPLGVVEVREIIKEMNEDYGVTILISSHILSEVHQIATNYGFIHKGRLIEQINADQLDERSHAHILIEVDNVEKAVMTFEERLSFPRYEVLANGAIKMYSHLQQAKEISQILMEEGITIQQFTPQRNTLEEYFTNLVKESDHNVEPISR